MGSSPKTAPHTVKIDATGDLVRAWWDDDMGAVTVDWASLRMVLSVHETNGLAHALLAVVPSNLSTMTPPGQASTADLRLALARIVKARRLGESMVMHQAIDEAAALIG